MRYEVKTETGTYFADNAAEIGQIVKNTDLCRGNYAVYQRNTDGSIKKVLSKKVSQ
jgi:hypothetical protein